MRPIHRIIVHHSASPRSVTRDTIDRWHRDKGWSGCGYHWVVEGDGKQVVGRPEERIGAHARGANWNSIGVCVVGDNTRPEHAWTGPQWVALLNLLADLRARFPGAEVLGHRDVPGAHTACPGLDLRPILAADEPLRAAGVEVAGGE